MPPGMKVGYDATAAVSQGAGIGRYSRELLAALLKAEPSNRYAVFYASRRPSIRFSDPDGRLSIASLPITDREANAVWQRLRLPLPIEFRTGKIDLMHCPDFSLPPSLAPSIATVHDLAFEVVPQYSYPSLAAYLHVVTPRSVKRARAVVVTSANTKADVISRYGTSPDKIHVIPIGASESFTPVAGTNDLSILQGYGIQRPFILTVGTLEPRKNLERVLEAFAKLPVDLDDVSLIIVGRPGWMYNGIFETHQRLELGARVKFLESVNDEQLAALYRQAEISVYASLYEGFGLPPLEALASGCPVACSGNSAVGELVAGTAEIFDPWDVEDIATTIEGLLRDSERREELRLAGPRRAEQFSWNAIALRMLSLYRNVLDG